MVEYGFRADLPAQIKLPIIDIDVLKNGGKRYGVKAYQKVRGEGTQKVL